MVSGKEGCPVIDEVLYMPIALANIRVTNLQVADILKNKKTILAAYESNASTSKKGRLSKFSDVNERLYEWYTMACSKNIYPGGPQLIAKAKKIADRLGKSDLVGSGVCADCISGQC